MQDPLQLAHTRRHFFSRSAKGIGTVALASLLERDAQASMGLPGMPHHTAKAKRVLFLHQSGGPSQIDLFDYKPQMSKHQGVDLPASIRMGQRITGMTSGQSTFPVASTVFKFAQHGQQGAWVSELLPHTAKVIDQLCVIKSMHTDAINHDPAITFIQSGSQQPGRPSMGAWVSYGLGSENDNLPAYVVLISQANAINNDQPLFSRLWGNGFLPSSHQGVKFRSGGDPVLYLSDPPGVDKNTRRQMLDAVAKINRIKQESSADPEIETRIAQYEMAYRMQMSVPELTDFSDEDPETLAMYGPEVNKPGSFAANCLLARRLSERGVRFVQLYMRGWDAHNNLPEEIRLQSEAVDQPQAALIKDLRRRGMLDDTIVLWAGEFGRTVYSQGVLSEPNYGRDHHPRCFTIWMAGGGVKPGIVHGATDDYSYNIVENPVDVHDLHATLLHLLGFDHTQLTYRHQGRDFRLTDVFGKVVPEVVV